MKVVEHLIQEVYEGKQDDIRASDERYYAIEKTLGFPPKRRIWCMSGAHNWGMSIQVREWESLAAMEAAYEKAGANADFQALNESDSGIVKSSRLELYWVAE